MKKVLGTQTSPFGEVTDQLWESEHFCAALFNSPGISRLSIVRKDFSSKSMSWEELQQVKCGCGFDCIDAVEIYPCECDVVNTGNVRHLFLMPHPIPFAWRVQPGETQPLLGDL